MLVDPHLTLKRQVLSRRVIGQLAEEAAASYLAEKGYAIIDRNLRTPFGEIDIVARDGEFVVFVEVRSKKSETFGFPEESVTMRKLERLRRSVEWYVNGKGLSKLQPRIELLSVTKDPGGRLKFNLVRDVSF